MDHLGGNVPFDRNGELSRSAAHKLVQLCPSGAVTVVGPLHRTNLNAPARTQPPR